MADFLTPADRSLRMSRVRCKDTLPKVRLRRFTGSVSDIE